MNRRGQCRRSPATPEGSGTRWPHAAGASPPPASTRDSVAAARPLPDPPAIPLSCNNSRITTTGRTRRVQVYFRRATAALRRHNYILRALRSPDDGEPRAIAVQILITGGEPVPPTLPVRRQVSGGPRGAPPREPTLRHPTTLAGGEPCAHLVETGGRRNLTAECRVWMWLAGDSEAGHGKCATLTDTTHAERVTTNDRIPNGARRSAPVGIGIGVQIQSGMTR